MNSVLNNQVDKNTVLKVILPKGSFGRENGMMLYNFVNKLKNYNALILDFQYITTIDSKGISLVIDMLKLCNYKKIHFIISSLNKRINPYFKKVLDNNQVTINSGCGRLEKLFNRDNSDYNSTLNKARYVEFQIDTTMSQKNKLIRNIKKAIRAYSQDKQLV